MLTGVAVAKMTNNELSARGLKTIPPQMIYRYIAQGYIPAHDENGARRVSAQDAATWIEAYVGRRVAKQVGPVLVSE
jgi:hypothetical protein